MAGVFVIAKGPTLETSEDGLNWQQTHIMSGSAQIRSLAYSEGVIVGVGTLGSIVRSTDGYTWTAITSGTGSNILNVVYGAGVFMALTTSPQQLLISYDKGLTWTIKPKTLIGPELSYAFGYFYLNGYISSGKLQVYRSDDLGETWSLYALWGESSPAKPERVRFHESENYLIGVGDPWADSGTVIPHSIARANPDGSNFQTFDYGTPSADYIRARASIVHRNVLHIFSSGQFNFAGSYATLDPDNLPTELTAPTMSGGGDGYIWSGVAAGDDIMVAVASDGGGSNPERMARLDLSQPSPAWVFNSTQTSTIRAIVYASFKGGLAKVWSGSSYIEKPVKVWDGANWEQKPAKYWDGTNWVQNWVE